MDTSPTALAKLLVPRIPFLLKNALFHSISWSPTSSKWDLRTELTVKLIRDLTSGNNPRTLSEVQAQTLKDPGIKGNMWISKTTSPIPPEDDVRQLLFKAIDDMKEGQETYTKPNYVTVEAEWTGYRADATNNSPEPAISEAEKYGNLIKEVKSDVTILYFHGGAHYLLDPAMYRQHASRLAKLTGGRVYNVRYRLSPQNPFPAAILDALISYITLLHPPPGSPHTAIPAKNIVFAGDSAGGNICFSLLQLLLQVHRSCGGAIPTVRWHGKDVEVPLPAGVAGNSPWLDVTRCLPSLESNAQYDYLPPPSQSADRKIPPCPIWPANPPRADIYCDGPTMAHPLVSPLAAPHWENSPPLCFVMGEEMLADENKVLAARAAKQGVKVVYDVYEAMPHVFCIMLEGAAASKTCWERWAKFCKDAVEKPESLRTVGTEFAVKTLEERKLDVEALAPCSDEEVGRLMREARQKKIDGVEKAGKAEALPQKI